jgi:hypothetical protein
MYTLEKGEKQDAQSSKKENVETNFSKNSFPFWQ